MQNTTDREAITHNMMERIDVHAHCITPAWREYALKSDFAGRSNPDGMPAIPAWDVASHLATMKQMNITKSILSVSSPGTHLSPGNDVEARNLTRQTNKDIANICASNPEHFLFFASLPLPDVQGSLEEIDYALDHLGAVGFVILSNSHGIYPSNPKFRPVFDKLNERKTIAFFHPTSCHLRHADSGDIETVNPMPELPGPMLEFMLESTRVITGLLLSGTLARSTDVTFLFCHCGAAFPSVASRVAEFSALLLPKENKVTQEQIRDTFQKRVFFDLAGVPFPDQAPGLLRLVDTSRLLYGSDYPYTPAFVVKGLAEKMDNALQHDLGSDVREQVLLNNAQVFLQKKL